MRNSLELYLRKLLNTSTLSSRVPNQQAHEQISKYVMVLVLPINIMY